MSTVAPNTPNTGTARRALSLGLVVVQLLGPALGVATLWATICLRGELISRGSGVGCGFSGGCVWFDYCEFEHGWPWTFAARHTSVEETARWSTAGELDRLSWGALAADLAVGAAIVAAILFLSAWRVRNRGALWRWNLQEMLVLVTCAALPLAWWQWNVRRTRPEELALRELQMPGMVDATAYSQAPPDGESLLFYQDYTGPLWLARLANRDELLPFQRTTGLWMDRGIAPARLDWAAECFESLPQIESLTLDGKLIGADSLRAFRGLRRLKHVDAWDTRLTIRDLSTLPCDRIEELSYRTPNEEDFFNFAEGDVAALRRFPSLARLQLDNCRLSERHVRVLAQLPCLTELQLAGSEIDDRAVLLIGDCPRLSSVELPDDVLPQTVARLRRLRPDLDISGGTVEVDLEPVFRRYQM